MHAFTGTVFGISTNHWVYWIILGLIAGWATGRLVRGTGYGIIFDVVLGMVGAIIGGLIMSQLGLAAAGGFFYTLTVAIIGSVLLVAVTRLLTGRRV